MKYNIREKYSEGGVDLSKRINQNFLEIYKELDKDCCEKFGLTAGGVTEYINRLNNARFAPERDDVLTRLVRYRNVRNKFAHDITAVRKSDELSKSDLKWLKTFKKDLSRKKDPISVYLKKARRYARRRKFYKILFIVMLIVVVILALALWYVLSR